MKSLIVGVLFCTAGFAAAQPVCDPVCASQPAECCNVAPLVSVEVMFQGVTGSGRCLSDGTIVAAASAPFDSTPFVVNGAPFLPIITVDPEASQRFEGGGLACAGARLSGGVIPDTIVVNGQTIKVSNNKAYVCVPNQPVVAGDTVVLCLQSRTNNLPIPAACPDGVRVTDACVKATVL